MANPNAHFPYEFVKIWSQQIIDSRDYPEQYKNWDERRNPYGPPPMPFTSDVFYGDVQLGDFTLNYQQMNDILEPESYQALPKEKLVQVMKHEDADYHHIMKLHGLSDFGAYVAGEWVEPKIIEIERENDYAEH